MENLSIYKSTKGALIATPIPLQSRTYKPISHGQLIDLTLESVHQAGFTVDQEVYSMAKEGQIANGRFTIKSIADEEMQLEIGWQNSYNKQVTLKFAIGVHIFICSNGAIQGDFGTFKKKHVGEVQTFAPHMIMEYIRSAGDVFRVMQTSRNAMKQVEISKRATAEIVGRMFIEQGIITSTQLNIIKRELDHPTFNYGCDGSMWQLYNFVTYALKESHPSLWMQNHINVHQFFINEAGIIIPKKEPLQLSLYDAYDQLILTDGLGTV